MARNTFGRAVQANTRLNFQPEICKTKWDISETMPLTIRHVFSMESFRCWISGWVTHWVIRRCRASPYVFSIVYTIYHLDRERLLLDVSHELVSDCQKKLKNCYFVDFADIPARSSRILKPFGPAHAQLSPSVLPPITMIDAIRLEEQVFAFWLAQLV